MRLARILASRTYAIRAATSRDVHISRGILQLSSKRGCSRWLPRDRWWWICSFWRLHIDCSSNAYDDIQLNECWRRAGRSRLVSWYHMAFLSYRNRMVRTHETFMHRSWNSSYKCKSIMRQWGKFLTSVYHILNDIFGRLAKARCSQSHHQRLYACEINLQKRLARFYHRLGFLGD